MGIVFDQSLNTTDNVQFVSLSLGDDTKLVRDSANTFAMRNGTSPNNLNVYNTYTSNTDYERLEVKWDSGVPTIAVAVDGNGNYPNWLQIQNESSKFLVKHNGFEFQDATTLLQLNPTNIKVFKDFYPNNDGETSFGTSNNRWLHTYSVNGSFSGNLVVEDGGNQYIYNTYTDASNYERLELKWNISNVAEINTAASGTGIVRTLRMRQSGGSYWADWEAAGIKFYGAASLNFNVGSAATAFYKNINPDTNGSVSCGVSASRWSNTYSIDGSFSGDLNVEVGGSYKLYNLGAAGDTDTEYLETSFQFGKPVIRSLSTGNGVTRDLFVGSTSGARLEVRANGQVFVVGSGSSIGVTSSGVSLGGGAVYPASNDATTLGSSTRFWSRIYSVDGSFSGDLVTEAGGNNYIYNTYTDANNYERLEVKWDADKGYIGTTSAGTGTDRPVFVGGDVDGGICGMVANPATSIVYLTTNDAGGNRFYFRSSNMYSDGGVDLGTSANRWGTTYTDDLTVTNSVAIGDKYGFDGDTNTYIENIGTDWLGFTAGGLSMAGMRGFGTNKGIFMNPNENQDIDFHVGYNGGRAIDMDGATGDVTFGQNIYLNNTYTDASNYERLEVKWDANEATIESSAAGTGTQRRLNLDGDSVLIKAAGVNKFNVDSSINYSYQTLQPGTDSIHTLGASPRRWSNTYTDTITVTNDVDIEDGGSRSAPVIKLGGFNQTGIFAPAIYQVGITVAQRGLLIGTATANVGSTSNIGWRSAENHSTGLIDTTMWRDEAYAIGVRNVYDNSSNAFRIYNTYTDASNYERLEIKWDTNVAKIESTAAGTGSLRELHLDGYRLEFYYNGGLAMNIGDNGEVAVYRTFAPSADSAKLLGTSGRRWSTTYTDGIATNVETFTAASDTLNRLNNVALCDCTSNAITINLPAASTATGLQFYITKVDNSANTVTIDPDSSETIDGSATKVLTVQYQSVKVVSDGSNWYSVASQPSASDVEGSGTAGSLAVWTDTDTIGTGLLSESSNILTQKNSTNAQAYHLYNTDDGAGNYERLEFKWDSDVAKITPTSSGTGIDRNLELATGDGDTLLNIKPSSLEFYVLNSSTAKMDLISNSARFWVLPRPAADGLVGLGASSHRWSNVFTDSITIGDGVDAVLNADAADTLALRNSTNAQQFNVYNTYTDASNYERLEVKWDANVAMIEATSDGTGSNRVVAIGNGVGNSVAEFSTAGIRSAAVKPKADSVFELGGTSLRWLNTYTDKIILGNGVDAVLTASADNTLELTSGAAADQKFRIVGEDDGGGNREWLELRCASNGATFITTGGDGTGTGASVRIGGSGSSIIEVSSANTTSNGAIVPGTDSSYNLGVSSKRWLNTYTDNITIGDGVDAVLTADAADTLALRNSTNAQQFNIYNTYTDASNYERLEISNTQDGFNFNTESAGTGANQNISFSRAGSLKYVIGGTFNQFYAEIRPSSNGLYSCGTDALRWSNVYSVDGDFSGDLTVSGPEGKLFLQGQSSAFNTTSHASTVYNSDDDGGSYPFTSVGNLILQSRATAFRDIVFVTGSSTPTVRMVVTGNGNVGIGTNTPTSRLHVVGDIYNTGTITTDGGFADLLAVSGTSVPELRINSTDSVIFDADEFGRLQWYMNDANTNGTGPTARISAIFNDNTSGGPAQQTAGEGTDLVFSTGLVLVTGQTQTVTEKLRIDKNGTFKHAVGTNSYWYNLDTDASNYERFKLGWETNDFVISAEADGSGSIQDLDLVASQVAFKYTSGTGASTRISAGSNYIKMWRDMYPGSDSTWNCGLSANRWNAVCTDTIIIGNGVDAVLTADADNQLALRNSTNAQRFNIYNTYTDASNYERGQFRWGSNILVIGTESAGTGSNRSVWVNIGTSSTKFEFNSTTNKSNQNLQPGTDIVYNLGAASARWANTYTNRLYASDELVVGATSSSSVDHEVELYKRTLIESTSSQLFTVRRSGYPEMLNINSSQRVIRLFGNSDTGSADSNSLQIFGSQYLYNTYTDASNYERLEVKFDTNEAVITPTAAGTGTQRDLVLDGPDIRFRINGTDRFTINKSTSRVETGFDFRPISNNAVSCGAGDRRWFATYTNGLRTAIQTITAASDTLGGNDNINLCDCTSNNITINLPAASGREGLQYHIKKIDSSSNTVTVDADGTETIDGALTQVISAQYESITIVCDGSNWHII